MIAAASFPQEIFGKLEPRQVPCVGLVESFDREDHSQDEALEENDAPVDLAKGDVVFEELRVTETVGATLSVPRSPKYSIVDVADPLLLGSDLLWLIL